jgi:hypothetical protein
MGQPDAALLAAAAKTGLIWVRPDAGGRTWAVWHVWHEGAFVLVAGPGEQELPEVPETVEVVVRSKDSGARLLTVTARAQVLGPDDARWPAAAGALAASRLNSAHAPADLPDHWRTTGVRIVRLLPADSGEHPGSYHTGSGAAPPSPSPATTSGWRPWHLRGRRGLRRARRSRR